MWKCGFVCTVINYVVFILVFQPSLSTMSILREELNTMEPIDFWRAHGDSDSQTLEVYL